MATEDTDEDFFEIPTENSLAKIAIVERFFTKWASVMVRSKQNRALEGDIRFAYIDLFCGPGVYVDGTPSTPIRILSAATKIDSPRLSRKFLPHFAARFNDARPDRIEELERQISKHFSNGEFRPGQITTSSIELRLGIEGIHNSIGKVPTLSFIDPFGVKGMTKKLVGDLISTKGSDCILFINYKKFNRFISAAHYREHFEGFFGTDIYNKLRSQFSDSMQSVQSRESLIVQSVKEALRTVRARPVEPFKFFDEDGSRTSHFLFIATKHELGESYWKDAIKPKAYASQQGVSLFEFSSKPDISKSDKIQSNFDFQDGPLDVLKRRIEAALKDGKTKTIKELASLLTAGTRYQDRNVKDALLMLEAEGKIAIVRATNRRVGTPVGDSALVTWNLNKGN